MIREYDIGKIGFGDCSYCGDIIVEKALPYNSEKFLYLASSDFKVMFCGQHCFREYMSSYNTPTVIAQRKPLIKEDHFNHYR